MELDIRQVSEERGRICDRILRSLPLWFGIESAIQQYVSDVERMPMFAAFAEAGSIGFLSLNLHNQWSAEIHVMAVHPDWHRKNVGKRLLAIAEAYLRGAKYEFLAVKTLSPAHPSKEYEMTRCFYLAAGFRPLEEQPMIWGEALPCLLMIKALSFQQP